MSTQSTRSIVIFIAVNIIFEGGSLVIVNHIPELFVLVFKLFYCFFFLNQVDGRTINLGLSIKTKVKPGFKVINR